ncbi:MAG TPA: tRNA preQ1(34) S-adenosylmethionine ribosyltransferase-isomerase QueA [Methylophilaceae bacterium]|jgi:S-adenosylmethionine:tRNA ribosyltransferase-isomerase|nr:tRNA preQ1(34) S-adenosylmethionine ribosyltransferase-isomerase QueA [Methylophilaceae bacterium]
MRTSDFDFELPVELIAQFPASRRSGSRLLCLDGNSGALQDRMFSELPSLLSTGDLLVFNDTRVIKARLNGCKESGGKVEVLVERMLDAHRALAHVRASHAPKPGSRLILAEAVAVEVLSRQDDLFELKFLDETPLTELLERYGKLPLPPYITHAADNDDDDRYQTVYARNPGAVAAPTAGLHFDNDVMQALADCGVEKAFVTLHVGAGTFQPVRVEDVTEHKMHSEWYEIPQSTVDSIAQTRQRGGKVVAVGTTAMRALESAACQGELAAGGGDTDIFITPGYRFRLVDRLLTNFHLPRTTLLMLVSAFGGMEHIRKAYQHAVQERYRFFSYGDAMLIERQHIPDVASE